MSAHFVQECLSLHKQNKPKEVKRILRAKTHAEREQFRKALRGYRAFKRSAPPQLKEAVGAEKRRRISLNTVLRQQLALIRLARICKWEDRKVKN